MAATLLFRNNPLQRWKENTTACSKPPVLVIYSGTVQYLIGVNAE